MELEAVVLNNGLNALAGLGLETQSEPAQKSNPTPAKPSGNTRLQHSKDF